MTPLAQRALRNLMGVGGEPPLVNPGRFSNADLLGSLSKAVCFELSEVAEVIPNLGYSLLGKYQDENGRDRLDGTADAKYSFLPAPTTWVELVHKGGGEKLAIRVGYLVEDIGSGMLTGQLFLARPQPGRPIVKVAEFVQWKVGSEHEGEVRSFPKLVDWVDQQLVDNLVIDLYALLALINSPKTIGRTTHPAHAGLARELRRSFVGPIELRPWHEIKLRITPPDLTEDEIRGGQFTFTKGRALHFCRAHLRMWKGRLILVSAHWRGDPKLGVARSRYTVTA